MLQAKSGGNSGYTNGVGHKLTSGHSLKKGPRPQKVPPYFKMFREKVVAQYRAEPFGLSKVKAEKCADEIMKIVRQNHRESRTVGLT